MNKNLTELLRKKQSQSVAGGAINWDARRDEYLAAVRRLYDQIATILADPVRKKTVELVRREKQLSENFIGTYAVDDLVLLVGNEQVRFSPRGRNIVGAAGRVDVLGDRGEVPLVLLPDAGWAFVQSRQPKLQTVPFDESALAEVLQLVMRD